MIISFFHNPLFKLIVVISLIYSCANLQNNKKMKDNIKFTYKYKMHDQDSIQIKLTKNNKVIYNWVANDLLYPGEIYYYDKAIDSSLINNPIQINDSIILINSIYIGNAYLSIIKNEKEIKCIESDFTFMLYLKDKNSIVYFPDSKSDYFEDEDQIAPLNIYNLSTNDTTQVQLPFHYISNFNNMGSPKNIDKEALKKFIKTHI